MHVSAHPSAMSFPAPCLDNLDMENMICDVIISKVFYMTGAYACKFETK